MIDIRGLNIVMDGVPFCRVDLTGESYGLNIVSDGVPWLGWSPDETPAGIILSPFWYHNSTLEAI